MLIEISPDHWVNFFIDNLPGICVGVGETHDGPPEPWLKEFPHRTIPGIRSSRATSSTTALEHDFEPSVSYKLALDHGFCIPLWKAGVDPLPPIVPDHPQRPRAAVAVGQALLQLGRDARATRSRAIPATSGWRYWRPAA